MGFVYSIILPYIGYAEMRQSKYVAVAFRWIDSLEELTQIYESIIQSSIETNYKLKRYKIEPHQPFKS